MKKQLEKADLKNYKTSNKRLKISFLQSKFIKDYSGKFLNNC